MNVNDRADVKAKTIKNMLEELDAIQGEIDYQVALIADAVYRGSGPKVAQAADDEVPANNPSMAIIIGEHVRRSEALLKELTKIKEVLW